MSKCSELTRFLYWKDEVILSLIMALLEGHDCDEMLFWLYELYYSGYEKECFALCNKIYYDFYSHLNPKLGNFICKNYEKWEKNRDDMIIGYVFRNLFGKKYTFNVFQMRQKMEKTSLPETIYRGRKPQWLEKYPKFTHNFLRSVSKKNYKNICYYLSIIEEKDLRETYLSMVKYFSEEQNVSIKINIIEDIIDDFCKEIYSNVRHFILSTFVYLIEEEENICLRKLFITLNNDQINEIKAINEEKIKPDYRTLCYKRQYKINPNIGSFKLKRENFENIEHEMWFHWEWHASFSPLWNKRMHEFNYSRNNDKREIEFKDDDIMEEFYQKYGFLEPDEQPKEIQNASTGAIDLNNWKNIHKVLKLSLNLIDFEDDFRYLY